MKMTRDRPELPSATLYVHVLSVWGLPLLLLALILLFSAFAPSTFLSVFTFQSILSSRSIYALIALAEMIPICANQFDLSVASMLGMAQVLAIGLQVRWNLPWELTAIVILAFGGAIGVINGILVTYFKISSFIATLGTGTVLLGLNEWYTGGQQIVGEMDPHFVAIASHVGPVPLPLIYVLACGALLWIVLEYLPLGRSLYVIGDNPRAAELTGIRVDRVVNLAFVAAGVVAAFGGLVLQAQLLVGQSTVGQELLLPAFTGALLGSTCIHPGRPNAWGTVLAVAVLAVTVAGLSQLGTPFYVEPLFDGTMLIIAVGLAVGAQRRRESGRDDGRRRAVEMQTQKAG
jgi:ribose transport system permease protein